MGLQDASSPLRSLPLYTVCSSDDTMLITPDRIVLSSAIGQPALREFGALTVYVARNEPFRLTIDGLPTQVIDFAIVPPHTPHLVATPDSCVTKILVEPERIDIEALYEQLAGSEAISLGIAERMRRGFAELPSVSSGDIDVDTMFFGSALPSRELDPRIAAVVDSINEDDAEKLSAEDCAAMAGLSFSRFTHLFRSETGNTFRGYRAWKHARNFMSFVNASSNLADVAMQLGYSDAAHFSRSIRQVYGITPKNISEISRQLRVLLHPDCRLQRAQRSAVPERGIRPAPTARQGD